MSGLSAGWLDREITLQAATRSRDEETGQEVLNWATVETDLPAQWLPGSATETWRARQIDATIECVYRLQYRSDVYPDVSRIIGHDSRLYDVKGVTEEGRQEGLLVAVAAKAESPS